MGNSREWWKKKYAVEEDYAKRLEKVSSLTLKRISGIYVFVRGDPSGLKFAYIGQAVDVRRRCAQHCIQHQQHIDNSIHSRKLYDPDKNSFGWRVAKVEYMPEQYLNDKEREYIANWGNAGYQLYNNTTGGQDGAKGALWGNQPAKKYHDGLKQGYKNARNFVKPLFDRYLTAVVKKQNKLSERMLEKFKNFLEEEEEKEGENNEC